MVASNRNFVLSHSPEELRLDVGVRGIFIFTINHEMNCITLSSPVSGIFEYSYDPESGQWLNCRDHHDMRGLVTRDLLRYFEGCPSF